MKRVKNTISKTLAMLLAVLMIVGTLPVTAFAEEDPILKIDGEIEIVATGVDGSYRDKISDQITLGDGDSTVLDDTIENEYDHPEIGIDGSAQVTAKEKEQNDVAFFAEEINSHELSQLVFRNGMQTTATEFQMEPEFDPEIKSYTVVVPDTVNGINGFAVWATLADTASGKITAEYKPIGVTKPIKMTLTSGKATGQPLGRMFGTNDIAGNTLQIAVDGVPAYEITIVRKATLKGLTIETQDSNNVELTPAFDGNIDKYGVEVPEGAELTVKPVAVATTSNITVNGESIENGLIKVTPNWNDTQSATIEVEVSGEPAKSSKYTIHLKQAKTLEVPVERQLSQLVFRNGMQTTATEFQVEPEFDPEIKSYTVVVPDTVNGINGFAVWATLADTASGKITAEYKPIGVTKPIKMTLTSGKATGQPLGRMFGTNDIVGNTLQIAVDGVPAYEITIVRKATLKGLTVETQDSNNVEMTPTFDGNIDKYEVEVPEGAELTVKPIAVATASNITVNGESIENGLIKVTPNWNDTQSATIEVEVSGESAQSSKYIIVLSQNKPEIDKLEIDSLPTKTEYKEGETFDNTGLVVKVCYKDGTSKIIENNKLTFSPSDSLSVTCSGVEVKYKDASVTIPISVTQAMEGDGSVENPYLIKSMDDFVTIRNEVKKGNSFKDCHFSIVADISFTSEWTPIGCLKDGAASTGNGINILPFSGTISGNGKKLSFAAGSKPLFNYVREASVSNFSIYAPFMDGYALVDKYTVDYGEDGDYSVGTGGSYEPGCPDTINISDVTILSGSIIKNGGFIGGFASGGNTVNMTNCLVQKDVKIGCNADGTSAENAQVGSFGGMVSGVFRNCISYAEVYGARRVGGIIGYKGQSMSLFTVENCKFYGKIVASGDYVGGIVGSGYSSSSAPNTMCVVIQNCESSATISGNDYVGGILGAESAIQCWDNGIGKICNNSFSGKLQCNGNKAGGIIGYMASLNRYTIIENNYYASGCGAKNGVGSVKYVDTSCYTHETRSDTIYFDTSKALPQISGVEFKNHNREDDPLGADLEKLFCTDKYAEERLEELKIEQVEDLINAIGTVTLDSKAKIERARAAYNALSNAAQKKVSNLNVLVAAEKAYDKLVKEAKEEEAAKRVNEVTSQIESISEDATVEELLDAILAFDTLTEEEKTASGKVEAVEALKKQIAEMIQTDTKTGISVSDVEWNIQLVVEKEQSAVQTGALQEKLGNNTLLGLWDIYLKDIVLSQEVQPDGTVLVKIPLTLLGDYSGFDGLAVVHYADDGTVEYLSSEIAEECVTFHATDFSYYAVVGYMGDSPLDDMMNDEANDTVVMPWIITGCCAVVLLGVVLFLNGKSKKELVGKYAE